MTYTTPPDGWFEVGSHIDFVVAGGKLEFSNDTGEDGLPLWERPIAENVLVTKYARALLKIRTMHYEEDVPENEWNQGWGMKWCGYCHSSWPCKTVQAFEEVTK